MQLIQVSRPAVLRVMLEVIKIFKDIHILYELVKITCPQSTG